MIHYDLFIVGGGINGCGIARDAAGRGLKTGLAEMGDLAQGTSSASTKLIHGGLRYLEHYEFRLVRDALREREILLKIASHIVRPMRFVLPHAPGMRPKWLLRLGLFLYDHIGGRISLPASRSLDLASDPAGRVLRETYTSGFEYSDCWVDDARLVILNARDAARCGADILTRTKMVGARLAGDKWIVTLALPDGGQSEVSAAMMINAVGPWADIAAKAIAGSGHRQRIRLVKGSHIVTPRLFDHDRAYIFQNRDGRIVFAIPYQGEFTLIGTTDNDFSGDPADVAMASGEADYLITAVNAYFRRQITDAEIIWSYAGVRALADAGPGKAQSASRDYRLVLEYAKDGAPLLTVLGGKITSYRTLAEHVIASLASTGSASPALIKPGWTATAPLPGSGHDAAKLDVLSRDMLARYDWLKPQILARWIAAYGGETAEICHIIHSDGGLGHHFGAGLHEAEVRWLMQNEWARTAADILWRRSKLGLYFNTAETEALDEWMAQKRSY